MDDQSYNIRVPKRWVRIALIVGATALIVAPLTAAANHVFNDVPGSHTFHNDITWLADADVTRGCNPPDNTEYCPDDNVTRGQMAAFMNRFAGYIGAEDGTQPRRITRQRLATPRLHRMPRQRRTRTILEASQRTPMHVPSRQSGSRRDRRTT